MANKKTSWMNLFKLYLEGDFSNYRFSFIKTIKNIHPLLSVLFLVSFIQIICFEFSIGFAVLNDNVANIIENLCYVYLGSFVFYFMVEIVPLTKRQFNFNKILKRKIRFLRRDFEALDYYLRGMVLDYHGERPLVDKLAYEYLFDKLNARNGWNNNLSELKSLFDNINSIIKEIMNYNNTIIDDNLFNILDYTHVIIEEIDVENYYNPDTEANLTKKKKFVEMLIDIYPEIMDKLNILTINYNKKANN